MNTGLQRVLEASLGIGLILLASGCASVQRDLRPLTDAEAERRYANDPRTTPATLAERERAVQERHWFEENRRH